MDFFHVPFRNDREDIYFIGCKNKIFLRLLKVYYKVECMISQKSKVFFNIKIKIKRFFIKIKQKSSN